MRVLFVNTNDTSGGAARAAARIMRGVQHSGVDAQMLVKYKNSQSKDVVPLSRYVPTNIFYAAIDWISQKIKNQIQHFRWRPYLETKQNVFMSDLRSTYMHDALQKLDYDIVHLHWVNQRFLDLRELKKIHKPIVWTLHDSWPFCGVCHYFIDCEKYKIHCGSCPMLGSCRERDLAYEVFEKKLEAYDDLNLHIVTPSRWLGECAKQSALLGRFPVSVIPNCIDVALFRPLSRDEICLIAERQQNAVVKRVLREATQEKRVAKPFILYGAMQAANDRRKGFASLLSAMQLLDRLGFEARFVVFGAEAQELPMQFKHIDVSFVGYINDSSLLTALYNMADVMVVPSLTENLSNTIMESLSCGTPVVAFDIGGNGDMIDHKQNGYLAKEQDTNDLAAGIRFCVEHNSNGILGDNARKSVLDRFTADIVVRKYIDIYHSFDALR